MLPSGRAEFQKSRDRSLFGWAAFPTRCRPLPRKNPPRLC